MLWMITKFIFCLLAAGAFGFIFGWILSSLIRNEKLEERYNQLKDDFDKQKAELNQAYSDLDHKEEECEHLNKKYQQIQKELLIKNMDIEEYEKKGLNLKDPTELELENNTLKEEIAEYKYLENENTLLHDEIKTLEEEKEKLLQKLEEKESLSLLPTSMTNIENSSKRDKKIVFKKLKKHLKRAKKELKIMESELKGRKKS